jgi:hypothetical protein
LSPDAELIINNVPVSVSEKEFKHALNFSIVNEHAVFLDGVCVKNELQSLFSNKPDESIWSSGRHKDPETQAFIAWQNAKFSCDLAFRCSMSVVLAYRALENDYDFYSECAKQLLLELLEKNDELKSDVSVRQNQFHLYISLSYVLLLIYIKEKNLERIQNVANKISEHLYSDKSKQNIPVAVGNVLKVMMILLILFREHKHKKSRAKIINVAMEFSKKGFSLFKENSPIMHIYEFGRVFDDLVILQSYARIIEDESFSFKNFSLAQLEEKCSSSAIRLCNGKQKDYIIKSMFELSAYTDVDNAILIKP